MGFGKGGGPHLPMPPPHPSTLEVGTMVEVNYRASGVWQAGKILVKHPDATFDVELNGENVEMKVPVTYLRPLPPEGFDGTGENRRHRHRHRHRRGEGADVEIENGGERRHHRHRRDDGGDAEVEEGGEGRH